MDIDPPTFTRINRAYCAYTEEDKNRYKKEGRCFYCDRQGHMARECPQKKTQASQSRPQFKKKSPHQGQKGFRKFNRPKPKPFGYGYTPKARGAFIEEAEEEEYDQDQEEFDPITELAARTAKLSEDQKETWVEEMKNHGINF
jgi:hypothetical protein